MAEENLNNNQQDSSSIKGVDNESTTIQSSNNSPVADGLYSLISSVIKDFDSAAITTSQSQDQLSDALDRLTTELDKLLEDAPSPFIMQHASRISGVRKRVKALNLVLKSIQRRIDNMDRMLSAGSTSGEIHTFRSAHSIILIHLPLYASPLTC